MFFSILFLQDNIRILFLFHAVRELELSSVLLFSDLCFICFYSVQAIIYE